MILTGQTVIVVDDDPFVCRMMARVLRIEGAETLEAGTVAAARVLAEQRSWFVSILLDVSIGAPTDGLDFASEVRARAPRTPVVLITGSGSRHQRAADELGVDLFQKPLGGTDAASRSAAAEGLARALSRSPAP